MRKIEINAEVSSAHGVRLREVIDVDDNASDEEIRADVDEIVLEWFSCGLSYAPSAAEITR